VRRNSWCVLDCLENLTSAGLLSATEFILRGLLSFLALAAKICTGKNARATGGPSEIRASLVP
jgi:hypothetical protein